ncbi:MAG: hypothetical protein WCJ30_26020 [Deltaproteobacteria bacterium]
MITRVIPTQVHPDRQELARQARELCVRFSRWADLLEEPSFADNGAEVDEAVAGLAPYSDPVREQSSDLRLMIADQLRRVADSRIPEVLHRLMRQGDARFAGLTAAFPNLADDVLLARGALALLSSGDITKKFTREALQEVIDAWRQRKEDVSMPETVAHGLSGLFAGSRLAAKGEAIRKAWSRQKVVLDARVLAAERALEWRFVSGELSRSGFGDVPVEQLEIIWEALPRP